jgi:hypothetical protein
MPELNQSLINVPNFSEITPRQIIVKTLPQNVI